MRDLIWTIIGLWIVWKIFNAFTGKQKSHHNRPDFQPNKEGELKVNKNGSTNNRFNPDCAEYVDYEEVK
ncbi:MAG: hypothetical protein K0R26_298 [Bacteroidota bacterium]|nr:hypothetical protein [Bacteroidota bacterium]